MTLRVLLPIMTYPDVTPSAPLPAALDLVAALDSRITAVIHEVDIPPINNPVADFLIGLGKQADAAERLSRQNGEQVAGELKLLANRLSIHLVTEKFRAERPGGELIAVKARSFDLTMLVCQHDSPDHALLEQDVLFGSGGPVIIFPATDAPAHISTVALAWDGSRAAARAARDALPLLRRAGSVRVLTCQQDKPISQTSIDGILALLDGHGIAAEHVPVSLTHDHIGASLLAEAIAQDAGLLVMGAYGHSRMREFILGGATASALASPKLPLLMSH